MDASPFSHARSRGLVYAAVVNALIQCGWQPPTVFLSHNHELIGSHLASLSSSTLTILQEDLATLHGSSSNQDNTESSIKEFGTVDKADQPTVLHDDAAGLQHRGSSQHGRQRASPPALNVVDLCDSPGLSASPSTTDSTLKSSIQFTGEEDRIPSNATSVSHTHAPNRAVARVVSGGITKASNKVQASGKVTPQATSALARKNRTTLPASRSPVHQKHRAYCVLAEAPPLSDTRSLHAPPRPHERAVAADYFTPRSSPEPGEIRAKPLQFSMDDIVALIEEEKSKAPYEKQLRPGTAGRLSIQRADAGTEKRVRTQETAGNDARACGEVRDHDDRRLKKAKLGRKPMDYNNAMT